MLADLGFGAIAACMLVSALRVVRGADLVHAVLWLGATLTTTAALYALLGASFLAGVQVLVYVGGVTTLMIFGLMITRRHEGIVVRAETRERARGALVAGGLFGVVALAIRATPGLDEAVVLAPSIGPSELGRGLVVDHVLAFEVLSVLLLAAMIGALVLARRRDPTRAPSPAPRAATSPELPR